MSLQFDNESSTKIIYITKPSLRQEKSTDELNESYVDNNFVKNKHTTSINVFICNELKHLNLDGKNKATGGFMKEMVKYEMGGYSDKMTFFKYYFIETVPFGNGNFGIVLKSKCKTENVEYAIKINKMSVSSQHQKDELYKEVQMLQICQGHKNVIKLYNSFEQYGKIYQQLEFCSKTLWDIVYKLEFIPNDLLHSYIIDMLDGTAYIHSLNIIHMDLKLENILVSSQNICKIADFGLSISSIRAQQTEDDDIEDLMYHRMEILGETPTTAVDIFALGLLILELVTDIDIPSNGRQFNKLRKKIIPKKLKHNVSKCIVHLINNMICVDKDERLSAVNLLKQMNQTK